MRATFPTRALSAYASASASASPSGPPLSIFSIPIVSPPIRQAAPRFRVPFFHLPSHKIPVKWSLYRPLLRSAPDERHRIAVQERWRRPRWRFCTSPRLTMGLIVREERMLEDYNKAVKELLSRLGGEQGTAANEGKELVGATGDAGAATTDAVSRSTNAALDDIARNGQQATLAKRQANTHDPPVALLNSATAGVLDDELEDTPLQDVQVVRPRLYSRLYGLDEDVADRLDKLEKALEKRDLRRRMEVTALHEYKTGLLDASRTLRPILSPGLLFPSHLNPGLPRLKPQPEHITMPLVKRQKARDRRQWQLRTWKEMSWHLKMEADFQGSSTDLPVAYVNSILADLRRSEGRDFARLRSKFTYDILEKRDEARRKMPKVLTAMKRKRDLAARLERVHQQLVSTEDTEYPSS